MLNCPFAAHLALWHLSDGIWAHATMGRASAMPASAIKIGISAFAWTARFTTSHLKIFSTVERAGLQGIEIPMLDPRSLPVAGIRSAAEATGLECTVCALLPNHCNPISPDPALRQNAVDHLKLCIETSAAMGATLLGGPLLAPIGYLPDHRPSSEEWSRATHVLQQLSGDLEAAQITLSIEPVNRSETFFLRTATEAKSLCEFVDLPNIGVTIDTFHSNIEDRSIPDSVRQLGARLKHLHASENDRGPLGRGHIPFPAIITALKEIDYRGYMMIEGFGYDPNETNAPGSLWAYQDVSPEELLTESAAYLKNIQSIGF
jgi:D-psicose/D-tagatose/L-ribulose 3-epimerase